MKDLFSSIYRITQDKEALVGNFLETNEEQILSNVTFYRETQDWEIDSFENFILTIYTPWILETKGQTYYGRYQ